MNVIMRLVYAALCLSPSVVLGVELEYPACTIEGRQSQDKDISQTRIADEHVTAALDIFVSIVKGRVRSRNSTESIEFTLERLVALREIPFRYVLRAAYLAESTNEIAMFDMSLQVPKSCLLAMLGVPGENWQNYTGVDPNAFDEDTSWVIAFTVRPSTLSLARGHLMPHYGYYVELLEKYGLRDRSELVPKGLRRRSKVSEDLSDPTNSDSELRYIGYVGEDSVQYVLECLEKADIVAAITHAHGIGSIQVQGRNVQRALELIKEDARLHGYSFTHDGD